MERLGDDTVYRYLPVVQPSFCFAQIARKWSDCQSSMLADTVEKGLKRSTPFFERPVEKRLPRFAHQAIKDDEGCLSFLRQPLDATFRGMQAHLTTTHRQPE